ncbi:MAG: DUF4142 domain-containing protein [Acidobacteriota bacterium]|nr:DUF4142 domain-containing protein [Acidobacteriota bacterium]
MQRNLVLLASLALMLSACATMDTQPAVDMTNATPEGQIVSIMMAANRGEADQGQAAATRATSEAVRSFAQMMVSDHTTALQAVQDTSNRAGVNAADSPIAMTLQSGSQQTITNLATYSGAAFDRAYMQSQVDLHQWLLTALDGSLIPSARTPELRTLLQTQRGAVAMHLERARSIAGSM